MNSLLLVVCNCGTAFHVSPFIVKNYISIESHTSNGDLLYWLFSPFTLHAFIWNCAIVLITHEDYAISFDL